MTPQPIHGGRAFGRLEIGPTWSMSMKSFGFELMFGHHRLHLQLEFWRWRTSIAWRRT